MTSFGKFLLISANLKTAFSKQMLTLPQLPILLQLLFIFTTNVFMAPHHIHQQQIQYC